MVDYISNRKKNFTKGGYRQFKSPNLFSGNNINVQRRGQKIDLKKYFKPFFWGLVLIVSIYVLFFSKYFQITEVLVEGNKLVETEQIKDQIGLNQNIFFFGQKKMSQKIRTSFPEIKDVQIYRGIPDALKIVVLEKDGELIWQSNGEKYLISSQGEVMKKVLPEESFPDYPVVVDMRNFSVEAGTKILSPNFIAFIANVKDNFFTETNIKPLDFEIQTTTFDVYLKTEAGFFVKLNSLRSSKKQIEGLKTVLAEKRQDVKEYVDLRIDGWAYYK